MRFEQNGMVLWYGTPDAPAPRDLVRAGVSGRAIGLTVTVGVQPIAARNTVLVQQTLGAVADVSTVETNRRGHATRFAQDAASRGVDVVAVFGGDGFVGIARPGQRGICHGRQYQALRVSRSCR